MSKPLDNPLSDQGMSASSDPSGEANVIEEGVLPRFSEVDVLHGPWAAMLS